MADGGDRDGGNAAVHGLGQGLGEDFGLLNNAVALSSLRADDLDGRARYAAATAPISLKDGIDLAELHLIDYYSLSTGLSRNQNIQKDGNIPSSNSISFARFIHDDGPVFHLESSTVDPQLISTLHPLDHKSCISIYKMCIDDNDNYHQNENDIKPRLPIFDNVVGSLIKKTQFHSKDVNEMLSDVDTYLWENNDNDLYIAGRENYNVNSLVIQYLDINYNDKIISSKTIEGCNRMMSLSNHNNTNSIIGLTNNSSIEILDVRDSFRKTNHNINLNYNFNNKACSMNVLDNLMGVGFENGIIKLYDIRNLSNRNFIELNGYQTGNITSLSITQNLNTNKSYVIGGGLSGQISIWSIEENKEYQFNYNNQILEKENQDLIFKSNFNNNNYSNINNTNIKNEFNKLKPNNKNLEFNQFEHGGDPIIQQNKDNDIDDDIYKKYLKTYTKLNFSNNDIENKETNRNKEIDLRYKYNHKLIKDISTSITISINKISISSIIWNQNNFGNFAILMKNGTLIADKIII